MTHTDRPADFVTFTLTSIRMLELHDIQWTTFELVLGFL